MPCTEGGFSRAGYTSLSETTTNDESSFKQFFKQIIAVSIILVCFLFAISSLKASGFGSFTYLKQKIYGVDTDNFVWTLTRKDYEPLGYFVSSDREYLTYKVLEDYDAVIEPYARMRLYVEDYSTEKQYYYAYEVCSLNSTSAPCHNGLLQASASGITYEDVIVACDPYEQYSIKLSRYSQSGIWQFDYEGTGLCLYVRREIRDLSVVDLNATMDAMYALWSTSSDHGKELYGVDFENITYLLEMHHFNAAWRDSDHFHEGNGFLAQHIKMTNIFEASVQLVDPSVSVPFWDFTIEETEGLHAYDSKVMTPDMFGSMMPPSNATYSYTYDSDKIVDYAIKDGRWAYITAEMNPSKFESLQSGYGYMRSPWNMNPSPYVTRFTGTSLMPECSTHYDMLSYTDLMDFMVQMETNPHASVHGDIGGSFGCDLFKPLLDAGYINNEDSVVKICKQWIFSMKSLYRKNMIRPKDCSLPDDVQSSSCSFICVDTDDDWKTGFSLQLVTKLLKGYVPSNMDDDGKDMWVDFVCGGDGARVFSGDHAESASPTDPSFWPMHPTLERLYQAKMMAGGFETTAWGVDAVEDDVCIRSECYENGEYDAWDECCYGHFEDSQMLDFINGKKELYYGPTNGETMAASDPTSSGYSMNYIYDGFDWGHCDDDYDFDSMLDSLYNASLTRRRQ